MSFGATKATAVYVSATELTATAPPGKGKAPVTVTGSGGTSAENPADEFTYDPPPAITALTVTEGPATGATEVTIEGTGFTPETRVFFGKTEAKVVSQSAERLTVISPPGSGEVPITVETPGGTTPEVAALTFKYKQPTQLTLQKPSEGNTGPTGTSGSTNAQAAAIPPPVLVKTGNVAPVTGDIFVKLPGAKDFVLLSSLRQIPFGSIVNASEGAVTVTTALPNGKTQTGEFFDGEFVLTQGKNGNVTVVLYGGSYAVCPTAGERSHVAIASASKASGKHAVRKLWANAHGKFSTKGNYAAGAVQGTEWLTEDLCEGTLIRVIRDKVKVTNLVTGHVYEVTTGHHYLAKAPKG